MSKQTFEELFKPPFIPLLCLMGSIGDSTERPLLHLSDYRGGGIYKDYENGKQLWDEFVEFTVTALNEKWERDFGEPLRWLKIAGGGCEGDCYKCPKCDLDIEDEVISYDHCPHCGQRLLQPEE